MFYSMPLPDSLALGIELDYHVRPHPVLTRYRVTTFDLRRQVRWHPLDRQIDSTARRGPSRIMVVVRVSVLPHFVPFPIRLHHHTALEPLPRLEPVSRLVSQLPSVEQISVGQQVTI